MLLASCDVEGRMDVHCQQDKSPHKAKSLRRRVLSHVIAANTTRTRVLSTHAIKMRASVTSMLSALGFLFRNVRVLALCDNMVSLAYLDKRWSNLLLLLVW
jgi:hypothetical protein